MTSPLLCLLTLLATGDAPSFPNLNLVNQDGQALRFYEDLIKDRTLVLHFIFTSCPSICPPMGAHFAALQKELAASGPKGVTLISVSIDPVTDTPGRLKAWRAKFGGTDGWQLVTGKKQDVDRLLKSLKVFAADINAHSPFVIIGNDRTGQWQYLNGLTPPATLIAKLKDLQQTPSPQGSGQPDQNHKAAATATPARGRGDQDTANPRPGNQGAAHYFTDTVLRDQNGRALHFYSDLLQGRTVVINAFYATCNSVCPVTMSSMAAIQDWAGDRLGKDLLLLSISVDPNRDTPDRLKAFAATLGAKPGWHFLTGEQAQVSLILRKLGQYTEQKEGHSNLLLIGNDRTQLWKKAMALAPPQQILPIVAGVLNDRRPPNN